MYKAKDLLSGKIVALKKVQYDLETESVKFMAREILILRRLDHPNVLKLEGWCFPDCLVLCILYLNTWSMIWLVLLHSLELSLRCLRSLSHLVELFACFIKLVESNTLSFTCP
ncbi:hypothetical protein Scep_019931 [Stephania cephalantha]|uniref:Protein kinase domain-containing protein n=1 Tax=Stephania cephalantha TaxID=152367 RepID=A0AAP0IC83_9MAGN